jgi:hypothetical protein
VHTDIHNRVYCSLWWKKCSSRVMPSSRSSSLPRNSKLDVHFDLVLLLCKYSYVHQPPFTRECEITSVLFVIESRTLRSWAGKNGHPHPRHPMLIWDTPKHILPTIPSTLKVMKHWS